MIKRILLLCIVLEILSLSFQNNFADSNSKSLYFSIGSTQMRICAGVQCSIVTLDASPELINSRTFIPVRAFVEEMGANVHWNPDKKEISIESNNKKVIVYIDHNKLISNGVEKYSDVSPYIKNNRTMLPLRLVSEELGYFIDWKFDESSFKEIRVSSKVIPYEPW